MGFLDRLLGRRPPEHPVADEANEAERRRAEGLDDRPSAADDVADRLEEGATDARTDQLIERRDHMTH